MVDLGPEVVPAIGATDPVEIRRLPQLERGPDLDRDVARLPLEVPKVLAVEEHRVQERIGGDLLGDLWRHRTDAGDLAHLCGPHVPRFATEWDTRIVTSGRLAAPPASIWA